MVIGEIILEFVLLLPT